MTVIFTMTDFHIVVILITIAHCNIYINKVVFWVIYEGNYDRIAYCCDFDYHCCDFDNHNIADSTIHHYVLHITRHFGNGPQ